MHGSSKRLRLWNVLPHGPIEKLADNLWRIKGSLPGTSLQRVMTVVRRDDGSLLLHSVIALQEPAMREIEQNSSIKALVLDDGATNRTDVISAGAQWSPCGCWWSRTT